MKISLNRKQELSAAMAILTAHDPYGKFLEILNGGKIPKTTEEMSVEDHAAILAAENKRAKRAQKRLKAL